MKRKPVNHERVFSSNDYAENYAKQHWKMAEKFGQDFGQKLAVQGFTSGKILDVGCGFGATNLALAQRFPDSDIFGIDLSEPLLELANHVAGEADLSGRVRFEKADVQQIPYPENSFDAALNINMVHLVDQPIKMLDEIERILIPGGYLYIADLRRSFLGLVEDEIRSAFTIPEAKDLFGQSEIRQGVFKWGLLWWNFEGRR
jgi:ubiquinone/menaquinone biosynthesis C-methylase UbiE